jgi:ribonuclease HI
MHILARRVFFDGACGPVNPGGGATFGWRLVGPDGRMLASGRGEVCRGPGATNNLAEWHALLRAIRSLAGCGWRGRLRICGDFRLVINQLTGRWKCHKKELRRCRDECLGLLAGFAWEAFWVPREENREADALSRGGDLAGPDVRVAAGTPCAAVAPSGGPRAVPGIGCPDR